MSQLNNELSLYIIRLDEKNRELENANKTIKKMMNTDYLTKLLNRRAFRNYLWKAIYLANRHKTPFSLVGNGRH